MSTNETIATDGVTSSFLSFKLGDDDERFAINVLEVIEILEVPKITQVPRSPDYLKGVVNLRGNVLPVIDTRVKFEMESAEMTVETCIVVMEVIISGKKVVIGALVDCVYEVIEILPDQIKPAPSLGGDYNSEFIEGVVRHNDDFIMLLNIGKVFSSADVSLLTGASEMAAENA